MTTFDITAGPISPNDVVKIKDISIPGDVYAVINTLIFEKFSGISAEVPQDDIVTRLEAIGYPRDAIFAKGYLNIEDVYRAKGWIVKYDKPGYNESYSAYFKFSRK